MKEKFVCSKCGKKYTRKSLAIIKGKFLCFNCKRSVYNGMILQPIENYDKLLKKVYEIKPVGNEKHLYGHCRFNLALVGLKFKIVPIIEDKREVKGEDGRTTRLVKKTSRKY